MSKKLTKDEIRIRIKAINKIYNDFLIEINKLKKEQREIIYRYIKKEEKKRVKDIKGELN